MGGAGMKVASHCKYEIKNDNFFQAMFHAREVREPIFFTKVLKKLINNYSGNIVNNDAYVG